MAAEFIGYAIVVTLRSPPGQVSGIVENVVNQQLILRDGLSDLLVWLHGTNLSQLI